MTMDEPKPRCLRLIVTAVYDDGTSAVLDIPEPLEATMDFKYVPEIPLDLTTISFALDRAEFTIRVKHAVMAPQHAQLTIVPVAE